MSITIHSPGEGDDRLILWEHKDPNEDGEKIVPPGYEVRVIEAYVKFTDP